jgi:hypothetical protein
MIRAGGGMAGAATVRAESEAVRGQGVAHERLEPVKWIAIILMSVDHVLIAFPDPWAHAGYLAGRPCVALFSWILVSRLATGGPALSGRLVRRLLLWGLIAQPIYWMLTRNLAFRLDVLFTLAGGAALVWLLERRRYGLAAGVGLLCVCAWPWLDGGGLAPIAMAAAWLLLARGRLWVGLAVITATSAAHNAWVMPGYWPAVAAVLVSPLLVVGIMALAPRVPRLPRWMFYAYYPVHLALILLILGPYA